jgi:thioredoxin-like negative regulator of GroEL
MGLGVLAANFQPEHLPNERSKVWDRYASLLLSKWDESRGLAQQPWGESAKRHRLEDLAYWLHSIGRKREDATAISCSALRTKLLQQMESQATSESEDESRAFMNHVRTRSGFLLERGADVCSFASYGTQEYFTACAVLRRYRTEGGVSFLQGVLRDIAEADLWRDVLLMALAKLPWRTGSRQLLNLVKADSGPNGDPLRRAVLFAAHCLISGLRVEDEALGVVLDEVLRLGETSSLEDQKEQFGEVLAALAGTVELREKVMRRLASAIRQEEDVSGYEVALSALRSLAAGGDEGAMGLLRDLADETEDPVVQLSAAEALVAAMQTSEAVLILSGLVNTDRKVPREQRKQAIVTLGQIEDQDEMVLEALASVGDTSRDDTLRVAAARAIGNLGRKSEAVKIMLDVAETSSNGVLRRSALEELVQLEHADDDLIERLFQLSMEGVTEAVRSAASRSLGDLGQSQPAVGDRIWEIFQSGSSQGVRLAAAQSLIRAGDKERGVKALSEVISSSDNPRIQRDAVDSLVEFDIKDDIIVSELVELAENSKNDDLRRAAGEALGLMGEVDLASRILMELAQGSGPSWVCRDAVKALAKIRGQDQELMSDLQPLARNATDGRVRLAAAEAMAMVGDPDRAALWLLGLARSSHQGEWIRRDALKALGELDIEDEKILNGVETLLPSGTPDNLRRHAAEVLMGWNRKEEAIQTLLEIAEGARDDRIRREAIYSLEAVGGGSVEIIDALLQTAADQSSRWVADSALEVSHRLVFGGEAQG